MIDIAYYPQAFSSDRRFSIIIPTWNNLDYLRLCVDSLRKNSSFEHQIICHINDGSDGTLAWVRAQGIDYTHSEENVGICWAVNAAAGLAATDYIVYMNDDMYACPKWDWYLWQEIKSLGHNRFFLSSTMIEPTDTQNPCVIVMPECGQDIGSFDEERLLRVFDMEEKPDWSGSTWPPNIVPRRLWEQVGGYSIEFSPGMYSDPDFSMKLWRAGVRYYKGLGKSRVFHFQCKSTGRVVKNDGRTQFLKKWGISASRFVKDYLCRGKPFGGDLREPERNRWKELKDRARR